MSIKTAYDRLHNKHIHATCRFKPLGLTDYWLAFIELLIAKFTHASSLNFHLPYEIQFKTYRDTRKGMRFIHFVNRLAQLIHVRIFWENTNILSTDDWVYIENPAFIPDSIPLCFDLGHFMLGEKSKETTLKKIDAFFSHHGTQIKHLHLHINDFKRDKHNADEKDVRAFLGEERFNKLTHGRTYIFEVDS